VTLTLPAHIPWAVHRIATSRRYNDSLHTILSRWSVADVFDANDVLDALDAARPEE
jgi:hypothetical protein